MSRQTVEEYLETINTLEEMGGSPVRTSSLARVMEVSSASASEMLRRLSAKRMVNYTPYGGVSLTEEGWQYVTKLTRRHRLWEVFLNRYLGIGWHEVYDEACKLEHNTSDMVAEKLAHFLGKPQTCPHGSPIPYGKIQPPEVSGILLAKMDTGQKAQIIQITNERNSELLGHLNELGLIPSTEVEVSEKASFDGTLMVKVGDCIKAVSAEVASFIKVKPVS